MTIKKRMLAFVVLVLLSFSSCDSSYLESIPDSTTPVDSGIVGNTQEVVVSGEKYTYNNEDILLLCVENQTNKNYDVTIIVHYFDAAGIEIKSQKQTFTGLASGYQNYFLFQPNSTFDAYTHTMELEEIDSEECYAEQITATFVELREFLSVRRELV